MVGQPKHLHDLNKIEADVRVTCRACGFEVDWTVADLSAHLLAIGGNLTWSEVTRLLVCRRQGCGSTRLRASVVPFARRQANLPRRIGKLDAHVIETTLAVLAEAAAQRRAPTSLEVRLALLVVYLYTRDAEPVRRFWARGSTPGRAVHETLGDVLGSVRHSLQRHGWLAPEPVAERTPTWPWASPAPPGWREGAGSMGRESGEQ